MMKQLLIVCVLVAFATSMTVDEQGHRDARWVHSVVSTPPREKASSQKRGNVANVRSSRQGAKKLQFLSGCNF